MRVVVNDANILIDLIDVGLLDLFFKLKFEMNIADSVVNEFENEFILGVTGSNPAVPTNFYK